MSEIICPKCGNAVLPKENFCSNCGTPLSTDIPQGGFTKEGVTRILLLAISSIYAPTIILACFLVSLSGGASNPDQLFSFVVIAAFPFVIAGSTFMAWKSYKREDYGITLFIILIPIVYFIFSFFIPGIWSAY